MGVQWRTNRSVNSQSQMDDEQRALWTIDGGINTSRHPQFLDNNNTSDESGVTISGQVAVRNRKPRTIVGPVAASVPQLLGVYQNQYLIRAISGTVQRWDTATSAWVNIMTGLNATARMTMTNFEFGGKPSILITNGVDAPRYWNTTTTGDVNTASAPKGKLIMNDTVRVFIAKGDVLNFCARLSANDWTTTKNSGFIQVFTPQGGDISGIIRSLGMRLIFKKDYVAELKGSNLQEYQLVDISNQVGCFSDLTLVEVQGILFWLGYKQVYAFSGGQPVPIGDPIIGFLETTDWTNPSLCFATTDGDNYYLGLGSVLLSYSTKFKVWHVNRTAQQNSYGTPFNNEWYTMDNTGTVYKEDQAGVRLPMTVVSPAFTEGAPELWKEYYALHVQAKVYSGTIEIWCSPTADGNDFVLIDTVSTITGTIDKAHIIPLDSFPLSHWFRIKLVVTGDAELLSVERFYNLLPADQ